MSSQLILPVSPVDNTHEEFIISESNKSVYSSMLDWQNWGNGPLQRVKYLYGAEASGKTCLAKLWETSISSLASYYILDNLDFEVDQEGLYGLLEGATRNSSYLLITSRHTIEDLNFGLPDLVSRLNAIEKYYINPPDNELLRALLIKHFANRQIHVSEEVLQFLVKRMDRSYIAVRSIVEAIDTLSLQDKKNITVKLVKQIVAD